MEDKQEIKSVIATPTSNDSTKELSISNNSLNSINLFNPTELDRAKAFLTEVMRSEKGGIKSVNDGLAILMRAKDLNLPFSTCIEHIHVINGKTGVDIHIIKALLSRAGCRWELVKDYQPLYEYTDGINVYNDGALPDYCKKVISRKEAEDKTKDGNDDTIFVYPVRWYRDIKGNKYKDYQLDANKFSIATTPVQAQEIVKAGKIAVFRIPNVPIDYITEYKLTRYIKGVETTSIGRFTYNEALAAGMFEKDTYKKYPRVLIGHRAFTYAAREIASDIIFGVMESTEIKIVNGQDISPIDITDSEYVEYENV